MADVLKILSEGGFEVEATDVSTPYQVGAPIDGAHYLPVAEGVRPQRYDAAPIEVVDRVAVTVQGSQVAEDLTAFPVYVDLSSFPTAFWSQITEAGGNIRVYEGDGAGGNGEERAREVQAVNTSRRRGVLYFSANLTAGADATFYVDASDPARVEPAAGSTYGSEAVWPSYMEGVWHLRDGALTDSTGNGHTLTPEGDPALRLMEASRSRDLYSHQGIASGPQHFYTTDTDTIYKWDRQWRLVAKNETPFEGIASDEVNHIGDCAVYGSELYVPAERYDSKTSYGSARMAVYRLDDLSFVRETMMPDPSREASGVWIDPESGRAFVSCYTDAGTPLQEHDPTDWSLVRQITVAGGVGEVQGVVGRDDLLYVTSGVDTAFVAYSLRRDGSDLTPLYRFPESGGAQANELEGLTVYDGALVVMMDTGGVKEARTMIQREGKMALCPLFAGDDHNGPRGSRYVADVGVSLDVATVTCAAVMEGDFQSIIFKYAAPDGSNGDAQIALDPDDGDDTGWYTPAHGWMYTGFDPPLGVPVHYAAHYDDNGPTREIIINGAVEASDNSALQDGRTEIMIGSADTDYDQAWRGEIADVRLYALRPSDAWLAAEHVNLCNPSDFYSLTPA